MSDNSPSYRLSLSSFLIIDSASIISDLLGEPLQ